MSAPRSCIILASLPSFCQKIIRVGRNLTKLWVTKTSLRGVFETQCVVTSDRRCHIQTSRRQFLDVWRRTFCYVASPLPSTYLSWYRGSQDWRCCAVTRQTRWTAAVHSLTAAAADSRRLEGCCERSNQPVVQSQIQRLQWTEPRRRQPWIVTQLCPQWRARIPVQFTSDRFDRQIFIVVHSNMCLCVCVCVNESCGAQFHRLQYNATYEQWY